MSKILEKYFKQYYDIKNGKILKEDHTNLNPEPIAKLIQNLYEEAFLEGQNRTTTDVIEFKAGLCYSTSLPVLTVNNQPKTEAKIKIDTIVLVKQNLNFLDKIKMCFSFYKSLSNLVKNS